MRALLMVPALLLAGCATGVRVTYHSDPPGATLYQDGQPIGKTPTTLTYQATPAFKSGGCQQLRGTLVRWVSGAEASISSLNVCASTGWGQQYTFTRPSVPGLDVDANFALQLQRNAILRDQANSAATANLLQAIQPPAPAYSPRRPIDCTSRRIGNTVQTDCW
jgi:hypothetical protein